MLEKIHNIKATTKWTRILGKEFDDLSTEAFETADGASRWTDGWLRTYTLAEGEYVIKVQYVQFHSDPNDLSKLDEVQFKLLDSKGRKVGSKLKVTKETVIYPVIKASRTRHYDINLVIDITKL